MDSKQTVMALYGAYATGDAEKIGHWLHDEVVWTAPAGNATQVALGLGRPEDAGPPRGANDLDHDAIVAFMAYNFARVFGGVDNSFRTVVVDGEVVVVPEAVGRRCMAKMNQFSWSSSWLVDEEICVRLHLSDRTWPPEQRRPCAPGNLRIDQRQGGRVRPGSRSPPGMGRVSEPSACGRTLLRQILLPSRP